MARHQKARLAEDCADTIGFLVWYGEHGYNIPFRWESGKADLAEYEKLRAYKEALHNWEHTPKALPLWAQIEARLEEKG